MVKFSRGHRVTYSGLIQARNYNDAYFQRVGTIEDEFKTVSDPNTGQAWECATVRWDDGVTADIPLDALRDLESSS